MRGLAFRYPVIGHRAALAIPPVALMAVAPGLPAAGQQRIPPEPVFPDLPEPIPPSGFLALRLHLTVRPVLPRYQATRFTVGGYVAVLPLKGRKWRKYTVGSTWTLRLAVPTIGVSALDDVWFSFTENDLAAPSDAASCRVIRSGGQRIDEEHSLVIQGAALPIAENSA